MIRFTKKVRDHVAKAVLTPMSLTILAFLSGQAWTTGNVWLLVLGVTLFLEIQFVALLLLSACEEE